MYQGGSQGGGGSNAPSIAPSEAPRQISTEVELNQKYEILVKLKTMAAPSVLDPTISDESAFDFSDYNVTEGRKKRLFDLIEAADTFSDLEKHVKHAICQIILEKEGNSLPAAHSSQLRKLLVFYSSKELDSAGVASPNEEILEKMFVILKNSSNLFELTGSISDSSATSIKNSVTDTLKGAATGVLAKINNLPAAGKTAVVLGVPALLVWWWKRKPKEGSRLGKLESGLKKIIGGGLKLGAGVMVGNWLTKQFTGGKGILEYGDSSLWNVERKTNLAKYFNLGNYPKDKREKVTLDVLLTSLKVPSEGKIGSQPFGKIVSSLNNNNNATNNAIRLIVDKFGPESELYKNNKRIKEYWNNAVLNPAWSWKSVVAQLISLDPSDNKKLFSEESKTKVEKPKSVTAPEQIPTDIVEIDAIAKKLAPSGISHKLDMLRKETDPTKMAQLIKEIREEAKKDSKNYGRVNISES